MPQPLNTRSQLRETPPLRVGAVDTGPLVHELLRAARNPDSKSRMREALRFAHVRIFITPHVNLEVTRDLRFHCERVGADYSIAWSLWNEEFRPRLRVVDIADFVDTVGRRPDVAAVAKRHPDDAPLAVLCELLGVRAWAEDKDLMVLGIGRSDWLKHELALVDAGRLDVVGWAGMVSTVESVAYVGRQAAQAYRATEASSLL